MSNNSSSNTTNNSNNINNLNSKSNHHYHNYSNNENRNKNAVLIKRHQVHATSDQACMQRGLSLVPCN